ncbi:MAG: porin family protein [Alphaproteobacteria bacterium]|nr:porin family protein [Alphaproteobacteria bacterium]
MKKIYVLAAAASVFAMNAQAADWSMGNLVRPYIGADYVYSHAKHGAIASDAKKDYNSWMVNIGTDIARYTSIEAFFQQAGERKTHLRGRDLKSEFYAWGLDVYGRVPVACSGFNLLGSLGLADYNVKYKFNPGSMDKEHIGYRGGVGFSYDFNNNVSFRVMGRYTYIGMANLNNLMEVTAGLRYTF